MIKSTKRGANGFTFSHYSQPCPATAGLTVMGWLVAVVRWWDGGMVGVKKCVNLLEANKEIDHKMDCVIDQPKHRAQVDHPTY